MDKDPVEVAALNLLARGEADWLSMCEVDWVVRRAFDERDTSKVIDNACRVMRHLFAAGLMQPGDLRGPGGFQPWPVTIEEAIAQIRRSWSEFPGQVPLGEVGWLCNTPQGDVVGRRVLTEQRGLLFDPEFGEPP